MFIRRVHEALPDFGALNSAHRILVESVVVPVLAGLFGDQAGGEGGQLTVDLFTEDLLFLMVLLTVLIKFF